MLKILLENISIRIGNAKLGNDILDHTLTENDKYTAPFSERSTMEKSFSRHVNFP